MLASNGYLRWPRAGICDPGVECYTRSTRQGSLARPHASGTSADNRLSRRMWRQRLFAYSAPTKLTSRVESGYTSAPRATVSSASTRRVTDLGASPFPAEAERLALCFGASVSSTALPVSTDRALVLTSRLNQKIGT